MTKENQNLTSSNQSPLERIFDVTGYTTQTQLAKLLGIRQSAVSDAKKRGTIPASWLIKLSEEYGISSEWIKYGSEPKYVKKKPLKDIPKIEDLAKNSNDKTQKKAQVLEQIGNLFINFSQLQK